MRRTKNKLSRFRKHSKNSKKNKVVKTKRRKYQRNRRTRKAGNLSRITAAAANTAKRIAQNPTANLAGRKFAEEALTTGAKEVFGILNKKYP
jgi:transposase